MSIFKKFIRTSNPAQFWLPEPGLEMEIDFNRSALCNVKIGDPFLYLEKLGPPEDPAKVPDGVLVYYVKGIEIDFTDDLIDAYCIFFSCHEGSKFTPFTGRLKYNGRAVEKDQISTEEGFLKMFGPAYWRTEDEDEILLFYEFGDIEWQVEFTRNGSLTSVIMLTPPMLADPADREAYKVTKKWPP